MYKVAIMNVKERLNALREDPVAMMELERRIGTKLAVLEILLVANMGTENDVGDGDGDGDGDGW